MRPECTFVAYVSEGLASRLCDSHVHNGPRATQHGGRYFCPTTFVQFAFSQSVVNVWHPLATGFAPIRPPEHGATNRDGVRWMFRSPANRTPFYWATRCSPVMGRGSIQALSCMASCRFARMVGVLKLREMEHSLPRMIIASGIIEVSRSTGAAQLPLRISRRGMVRVEPTARSPSRPPHRGAGSGLLAGARDPPTQRETRPGDPQ